MWDIHHICTMWCGINVAKLLTYLPIRAAFLPDLIAL